MGVLEFAGRSHQISSAFFLQESEQSIFLAEEKKKPLPILLFGNGSPSLYSGDNFLSQCELEYSSFYWDAKPHDADVFSSSVGTGTGFMIGELGRIRSDSSSIR